VGKDIHKVAKNCYKNSQIVHCLLRNVMLVSIATNVGGFGQVWDFPTVRPEPQLIICLVEVKN
jgi:hypothetical protein